MAHGVCLLIRKAPYGKIQAAEAVRHLNGALATGLETSVILIGDGVYLARRNQQAAKAGWTSLSDALGQIAGGEGAEKRKLLAHERSLCDRGLRTHDLIEGFKVIDDPHMAEVISGCHNVLLF